MPKVYIIVEDANRTFEDAVRFGEVEFLVSKDFNIWRPAMNETLFREIAFKLKDFEREDYLVLVGSPVLIAYAFHCVATSIDPVKILQWDRRGNKYEAISIGESR